MKFEKALRSGKESKKWALRSSARSHHIWRGRTSVGELFRNSAHWKAMEYWPGEPPTVFLRKFCAASSRTSAAIFRFTTTKLASLCSPHKPNESHRFYFGASGALWDRA